MYVSAPVSHTPVPCAQLPPQPQSLLQRCHSTFTLSCTGWKMVQWHTRRECTYIFHDKCLRHDVLISQDAPALAFHLNQPADNFRESLRAIKEGASQHRQAVCPTSSMLTMVLCCISVPCSWALLPAYGLVLALISTGAACRAALHVGQPANHNILE